MEVNKESKYEGMKKNRKKMKYSKFYEFIMKVVVIQFSI